MNELPRDPTDGAAEAGARVSSFSIRHPVTISMAFVAIVTLGLISMARIPLVLMPDVDFPGLFVWAPYPNATPEQIQESITKPLEEALSTIPGIQRMSSTSGADYAQVGMFFDWGTEVNMIRPVVREKIDQIRADLPSDLREVFVRGFGTEDIPIIEAAIASDRDLRSSYDFLDLKIKKPIERVAGVAEVALWGVQRRQLDVYFRLDDLKRYKVDVGAVVRRLNEANLNVSLGSVDDAGSRYSAVSKGVIASVDQVAQFPVNDRGLVLSDIAEIEFDNPTRNSGQHLNGDYAIGFAVRKASDANTVDTVRGVLDEIEELKRDPALTGLEVQVWHNAGDEITKALTGLLEAGTIGALLAVITLLLFLRKLMASLVIGFAIPFSIIAALGFIYLSGNTLNVFSMMGLMLSTGMLVDNAVVVLESIYQKLEKGETPETAARDGAGEVTTAVIAATLTSIIIFVPLVFGAETNMSAWLKHTGRAIIFALLCSLFISLTLIPVALARWIKLNVRGDRRERGDGIITRSYLRTVAWPLRHRFLVGFLLAPLLVAGSVWLLKNKIPDNTPESEELSALAIQYEFSENYHYVKIEEDFVRPVEAFLDENRDRFKIDNIFTNYGNDRAQTRVYFDKDRITLDEVQKIREEIREELPVIPGAKISPGRQEGAQNQTWLNANIFGESPTTLSEISEELRKQLLEREDFSEVHTDLDGAQQEVQIRLDRARARKYGISPESVAQVLGIVVRSRQIRGFRTPDGEVEMWVSLHPRDMQDRQDLASIVVGAGREGEPIELQQVADLELKKIPGEIQRENRQTFSPIYAIYSGDKKEEGRRIFSETLSDYPYPDGYGWSFGFWTQREQQEDQEFLFNILLALFMVYFVMASLFESLLHPFAIMLSLPFAIVGVAGFLYVTNTPYNIMAMIGMMVLIGVVVNNGIVLIDHINNLRRRGLPRHEAIMEGCRERLRPIAMTATTTVVGLIPLGFGESGFFDLRYFPMARTIMGGLMASTVLTLIVLPTYYTLLDDFGRYAKKIWFESSPDAQRREREEALAPTGD